MKNKEKIEKVNQIKEPPVSYGSNYTYADYLKFTIEETVEIIKGKIFKMSPAPKTIHQAISWNIVVQVGLNINKLNCKAFSAPFDVVLPVKNEKKNTATTVVQPDLCIICDHDKIDENGCTGPPDLIVEILSESTKHKDLNDKFSIYEESGVKEYWIVMPKEQLVEVFYLEQQKYQRIKTYTKEEIIRSEIFPDLEINLIDVFDSSSMSQK